MRRLITVGVVTLGLLVPSSGMASAEETTKVDKLSKVQGLTAEQKAAVLSFEKGGSVNVSAARGGKTKSVSSSSSRYSSSSQSASRRASYYRGSALMWTRDNVDFGYDWRSVTWTSAYQQAGWIWPNIARNRGITRYLNTTRNDRFRAKNTIGAGVPTPWGDVKVYSSDFTHRLSVNHNGAWSAWSD